MAQQRVDQVIVSVYGIVFRMINASFLFYSFAGANGMWIGLEGGSAYIIVGLLV